MDRIDMQLERLLKRPAQVSAARRLTGGWTAGTAAIGGQAYPCYALGEGKLPVAAYGRRQDGGAVLVCGEGHPIKPRIQEALGRLEPGTVWVCQYEHSCGALLVAEGERPARYLVIEGVGGHIGFPKGHIEAGEDIPAAVARELREEVGVTDFQYIDGYRVDASVVTRKGRDKDVTYFLASFAPSRNCLRCQTEEIRSLWLLDYEDARKRVNTALDRELLDKAEALLNARPEVF